MQEEESWVDRYYEALDFLYWEPQHLGRAKAVNSKLNTLTKVQMHLRLMEVTLNHLIKQFFSLAPSSFRNRLFECGLTGPVSGDLLMVGSNFDREYNLQNSTQPDFLFTTAEGTFSLEMKIDSRSSVQQVLKYALLALAVELKQGNKQMKHSLVFLAKGSFPNLWETRGAFTSVEALKQTLAKETHTFLNGKQKHFQELEQRYSEIVDSLSIGFISYESFAALLQNEIDLTDGGIGSLVYRKLLSAMLGELTRRRLTEPHGSLWQRGITTGFGSSLQG
jgi:hypothetical protein